MKGERLHKFNNLGTYNIISFGNIEMLVMHPDVRVEKVQNVKSENRRIGER